MWLKGSDDAMARKRFLYYWHFRDKSTSNEGPVKWSFDVFFVSLNCLLKKPFSCRWFQMPSIWSHCMECQPALHVLVPPIVFAWQYTPENIVHSRIAVKLSPLCTPFWQQLLVSIPLVQFSTNIQTFIDAKSAWINVKRYHTFDDYLYLCFVPKL